jgi:hypothetical protein
VYAPDCRSGHADATLREDGQDRSEEVDAAVTPCLICGAAPTDMHHWPRTRRYGNAVIPLCRQHHTIAHTGRLTEQLIELAQDYWQLNGMWPEVADEFESWMSRREYLRAVNV